MDRCCFNYGVCSPIDHWYLASRGAFNFIGTTNAAHLAYGMYAGAALFLIAEIVKVATNQCTTGRISNTPNVKSSGPLTQEEILSLKQEAELYAQDHYCVPSSDKSLPNPNGRGWISPDPTASEIKAAQKAQFDTIVKVIDKLDFQQNPVRYMQAWQLETYKPRVYTPIDDNARCFFIEALGKIRELPITIKQ